MKILTLLLTLFLCSCTVRVVDSRMTREELVAAFGQRDQMLSALASKITSIESNSKKENK